VSRSYRRPYAAFTSAESAHEDKKMAARGLRRRMNQWLHTLDDPETALTPHRFECPHNNTYAWDRDGRQNLFHPYNPYSDDDWAYRFWIKLQRK
jgi:hypothetical protein